MASYGYALRMEDQPLVLVSGALQEMTQPWGGAEAWWIEVSRRITLPAATQCPICNMAQLLGECTVALPLKGRADSGLAYFEIAFNGHSHGLSGAEGADLLIVRDASLMQQELNALRESVRTFESLCETISEVYFNVDRDGRIRFISPGCHRLLGYRPREMLGRRLVEFCVDPIYWDELQEILRVSSRVEDFDVLLYCRQGHQLPISLNGRLLLDQAGKPRGIEGSMRDVTEREQMDAMMAERTRKMQESLAELGHQKVALDQHATLLITDADGHITYANRKMVETSQFTQEELHGANPRVFNGAYHPKSFFKELWRTLTSGHIWRGEICNRRKDGLPFWLEMTIVPFMTPAGRPFQYVSIGTDITGRLQGEARIASSRDFLTRITDAMGEGMYCLDLEGRVTFLNRWAEKLLGWKEAEVLGRNLHDVIHFKRPDGTLVTPEECPVHRSLLGRVFRIDEDFFIHRDGQMLPVSYVTTPLMEGREIVGSVAVFQEISGRLTLEKDLRQQRDNAVEASQLKSEFLANMSHEIRTPMNAIIGMNDLLLDTALNNEQKEFSEIIKESADSLLSLINDILDFSKIEAGKIDLEEIDFTPVTVVEGAAELLASQAHAKGLSLMTFVAPRVPRVLRGDPGRLRQMLLNLISNAVKFTEEGEVVVRCELESEFPGEIRLLFSVSDTGIGLSKKVRSRLFQPFTQASDTSRKYGGTGLGLAICKRLVDLMGGEIGVESVEGEGARFWFALPLRRSTLKTAEESDKLNTHSLQDLSILLVMDQASDLEILTATLTSWKTRCCGVIGAQAALAALETARLEGQPFHLILVSEEVGDIPCLDFPEACRASGITNGTPMLVLADSHDKSWEEQARQVGYQAVLVKPVRQLELVETLIGAVDPASVMPFVEAFVPSENKETTTIPPAPDAYDALESGKLLLLAEDNPVNQKVAVMQLKKLGYAVHAVSNGKEAVEAVSHLPYALILMDCQMPVMDGFEATHVIRRMDRASSRHIPVIAMTANAMKGDRERCLKSGMDDYLSKPVSPEELRKKLEYWIPKSASDMPPIDITQLQQLFGHDEEVIRELMRHFMPSARELLDKLRECGHQKQAQDLVEAANELKGACSNMGASVMTRLARRLEQSAAAGDWQEVDSSLENLERAYRRVEAFVEDF
ncbi:MAG: PAS domain S-box protein [Magnetococcales bacterium]|nr:PAS domain S-box protein [Magnetococcales bacterium]